MNSKERIIALEAEAAKRVLVLDGAMGTQIQGFGLTEADFEGDRFKGWEIPLKGNNDLLNLTRPDIIKTIHRRYIDAGADFFESNTFSATTIAMADYKMEALADEIAEAGARLAREAADEASAELGRPIGVLGAIGPTNKTLSLSPNVNDPGFREVTFDDVRGAYYAQAKAMLPHVDFFLIETVFDTLNAKAAIKALLDLRADTGEEAPIIISGTITDASGRTLSGQTAEAFWNSVRHAKPWAIGLNCALGADLMRQHIAAISRIADTRVIAYPNAGLPNAFGEYDETPDQTAAHLDEWARAGIVNVLGGCCGTTPGHIAAIAKAAAGKTARVVPTLTGAMRLSGLEPFEGRKLMGKIHETLDDRLCEFIAAQKLFFVATAPLSGEGHVNMSPKGYDAFKILGADEVAYLDLGGSGIETQAHIQENGRITIMFCAFDGPANILRLYGHGEPIDFDHPDYAEMLAMFPGYDRARAIIKIKITRIQDSCGWGVPFYEFKGERDQLKRFVDNVETDEEWEERRRARNESSIDGLPGLKNPK